MLCYYYWKQHYKGIVMVTLNVCKNSCMRKRDLLSSFRGWDLYVGPTPYSSLAWSERIDKQLVSYLSRAAMKCQAPLRHR
jgi:hypothetical protein